MRSVFRQESKLMKRASQSAMIIYSAAPTSHGLCVLLNRWGGGIIPHAKVIFAFSSVFASNTQESWEKKQQSYSGWNSHMGREVSSYQIRPADFKFLGKAVTSSLHIRADSALMRQFPRRYGREPLGRNEFRGDRCSKQVVRSRRSQNYDRNREKISSDACSSRAGGPDT